MAGPWIKVEYATLEKQEILVAASRLKRDKDVIFARWFRLWRWADEHISADGVASGMTLSQLSDLAGLEGLAESLAEPIHDSHEPWLRQTAQGVVFKDFAKHNGHSAKQRALNSSRAKLSRKCRAQSATNVTIPSVSVSNSNSVSNSFSESERAKTVPPNKGEDRKQKPDDTFDRFWKAYPSKIAKKPCRAKWVKIIKDTDPEEIIRAATEYAQSRLGQEYPKNPLTWLNQACWEDDPKAWNHQPGSSRMPTMTDEERKAKEKEDWDALFGEEERQAQERKRIRALELEQQSAAKAHRNGM